MDTKLLEKKMENISPFATPTSPEPNYWNKPITIC